MLRALSCASSRTASGLVVNVLGKKVNGIIVGDHFYYVITAPYIGELVVDGRIRDLDGLSEIDMPAYFQHADATLIGTLC